MNNPEQSHAFEYQESNVGSREEGIKKLNTKIDQKSEFIQNRGLEIGKKPERGSENVGQEAMLKEIEKVIPPSPLDESLDIRGSVEDWKPVTEQLGNVEKISTEADKADFEILAKLSQSGFENMSDDDLAHLTRIT